MTTHVGLLGRLLAPQWTFASEGLTSGVFAKAEAAFQEGLQVRLGEGGARDVYHAFVASLTEAVSAIAGLRRHIHALRRRYYAHGRERDNLQLRQAVLALADTRFVHRFSCLLVRLGSWTDDTVVHAALAACTLHELRRAHNVPEYLLKAHTRAMDYHYLSHVLCQLPAQDGPVDLSLAYESGAGLVAAWRTWLPSALPPALGQPPVYEEQKDEAGDGEPAAAAAAVSGRFAPDAVCLWVVCDDAEGPELAWVKAQLPGAHETSGGAPPEGMGHVVALLCAPESAEDAVQTATAVAGGLPVGTSTLVVLLVSPAAASDPVDEPEPCLRYTDQLGQCLAERLRARGLFHTRVYVEMVWPTGSNAAAQMLLQDSEAWWHHAAETAANPMVGNVLRARCGPWTAGLCVALPDSVSMGVRHALLALVDDAALCRVVLTEALARDTNGTPSSSAVYTDVFQPHHTVVVVSDLATAEARASYRAAHLAQHTGAVVWLVVSAETQGCDTQQPDGAVATLCGVTPDAATLDLSRLLLTQPCNVRALQTLRRALGGRDD